LARQDFGAGYMLSPLRSGVREKIIYSKNRCTASKSRKTFATRLNFVKFQTKVNTEKIKSLTTFPVVADVSAVPRFPPQAKRLNYPLLSEYNAASASE
jgi:hypothetical protein